MLEAEGWTVWWDTSLAIGDDFRNEIMTELGRARAVIVIWTDASIKSDWVRSEAGRAQADRKLIPVKLEHLTYKDLPPPFDVLHTENVTEDDKIRAAVIAQLAKPAVEPTAWGLLTKGFKWELMTWVGIVGGALTLFTNLGSVLKLADWARVLVEHWRQWTHAFWVWAFGWLGIQLPVNWPPVLSFLLFGSLLAIGQAVKFNLPAKAQTMEGRHEGKAFQLIAWRTLVCLVITLPVSHWWNMSMHPGLFEYFGFRYNLRPIYLFLYNYIYLVGFILLPSVVLIMMFAHHKLYAGITLLLLAIFWYLIIWSNIHIVTFFQDGTSAFAFVQGTLLYSFVMTITPVLVPVILLSVAPAKAVSRRLIFLAIGLLLLIALNELSKLGLDVAAPKLQG
jgi:hypothetical protein